MNKYYMAYDWQDNLMTDYKFKTREQAQNYLNRCDMDGIIKEFNE